MEKLKDFFYNKNDIILALLILMIAVGIIYLRLAAISDYPAQQAKKLENSPVQNNQQKPNPQPETRNVSP